MNRKFILQTYQPRTPSLPDLRRTLIMTLWLDVKIWGQASEAARAIKERIERVKKGDYNDPRMD